MFGEHGRAVYTRQAEIYVSVRECEPCTLIKTFLRLGLHVFLIFIESTRR